MSTDWFGGCWKTMQKAHKHFQSYSYALQKKEYLLEQLTRIAKGREFPINRIPVLGTTC